MRYDRIYGACLHPEISYNNRMAIIHTPKEDGGWKQWFIRELSAIPSAFITFFAFIGIGMVIFLGPG